MRLSVISKLAGVAATALGLYLLYRVLSRYEVDEIRSALGDLSAVDLGLAAGFGVVSFLALSAGEFLAVRYAGHALPPSRVAKTTVAAIGIGHALGLAAFSSGAIRYRMYGRDGVDLPELGKIMLFSGLTVACGIACVGSVAMLARPQAIAAFIGLRPGQTQWLGAALLTAVLLYLAACLFVRGAVRLLHMTIALPGIRLALGQAIAGSANYASIAACLFACVRPFADAGYPTVAALYVGSDAAAVIGHVPGGWGVLEYVLTAALAQPGLIAGILVFRTVYYLVPLFVGLAVFAQDELAALRDRSRSATPEIERQARAVAPR